LLAKPSDCFLHPITSLKTIFKYLHLVLLIILICYIKPIKAQHSNASLQYYKIFEKEFFKAYLQNPALISHFNDSSYSDISLSWQAQETKEVYPIQEGNKNTVYSFNATSLYLNKKNTIYGSTSYKNAINKNIKWNSIADYRKLAPYIIADSLSGTMHWDQYYFDGGYANSFGKTEVGIYASYRTGIYFRKLDPRSKSTISELNAIFGMAHTISTNYKLAVQAKHKRYDQEFTIKNYRPGGSSKVFFLRGIGISDKSFSTVISQNNLAAFYEGRGVSLALQLLPTVDKGFFQNLYFSKNNIKLQDSHLDIISEILHKSYHYEFGRQYNTSTRNLSVKAYSQFSIKQGDEYNYDRNRQLLSTLNKYEENNFHLGAALTHLQKTNSKKNISVGTILEYSALSKEYKAHVPYDAKEEINNISLRIKTALQILFSKSSLIIQIKTGYTKVLSDELKTSSLAEQASINTLVLKDHYYQTRDCIPLIWKIRLDKKTKRTYGVYTEIRQFNSFHFGAKPMLGLQLAIGFAL